MRKPILFALVGMTMASCAQSGATESKPFVFAETEEQVSKALGSRYEILVLEGLGVPGSPSANVKLENARTVLQSIVDKCELGATTLIESTDGVITLHPELAAMNDEQVSCVRSFEQPGLIFRDKKAS